MFKVWLRRIIVRKIGCHPPRPRFPLPNGRQGINYQAVVRARNGRDTKLMISSKSPAVVAPGSAGDIKKRFV
jgi:hypothetical protein